MVFSRGASAVATPRPKTPPKGDDSVILAEIGARTKLLSDLTQLVRHAVTVGGVVWIMSIVMSSLEGIAQANPKAIHEIANVIKELRLHNIAGMMFGVIGTTWAIGERRGRKRAIEKAGRIQQKLEQSDAYNARSGLTPTGDTPGETND